MIFVTGRTGDNWDRMLSCIETNNAEDFYKKNTKENSGEISTPGCEVIRE